MTLKSAVLFLIVINSVFGQEFLFCLYGNIDSIYTCSINIFNPFENLDFAHINGTHLPGYDDDDVLAVTTGYSTSTANIPPIICNKFKNIEILSYRSMGLRIILDETFAGCTKVTSIDLSSNRIWHVDENSFDANEELQKLSFWSNELISLPENVFLNISNLKYLDLERNKINDLLDGIFKSQENLKKLWLNNNQISNLKPEWFENLKSLETLTLSSNKIEEVPLKTFSSLTSLQHIWMDNNNLEIIHSDSFGRLPNLEVMNVLNNQIIAIDEKILDLTSVSILIMPGNICSNGYIFDNSTGRQLMRTYFRPCFDKYEELFPACLVGDLNERVCTLEDENRELLSRTEILAKEKEELEKKFEDQIKAFNAAIENLQNQINELRIIPTTTEDSTTTSTTTEEDISTTEANTSTAVPSTTTETPTTSSSTTYEEISTTEVPSTTTEILTTSFSTTEEQISTTEVQASSAIPSSTTEDPSTTSSTTEEDISTTEVEFTENPSTITVIHTTTLSIPPTTEEEFSMTTETEATTIN